MLNMEMVSMEMAHRDFESIEDGRGLAPLLAVLEAGTNLEREREQEAIEAQDVLSQADEALVIG